MSRRMARYTLLLGQALARQGLYRADGRAVPILKLMAQYQETSEHRILLVREDWLQQTLQKINCSVVFGCLGEKSLFTKDVPSKSVGGWTQIDAIATFVDAQWHFGKPRLRSVEL